ncbi:hypothetical protein EYF80_064650 [Liparis tanakae]|uniref:Secreted protein n=1 Tax=Liparis tanakae TaxID=230148 RepID=A0A4Z2EAD1_9TELE|nr:hypothetical protein EYF80_064650 [Liparis tanakae]
MRHHVSKPIRSWLCSLLCYQLWFQLKPEGDPPPPSHHQAVSPFSSTTNPNTITTTTTTTPVSGLQGAVCRIRTRRHRPSRRLIDFTSAALRSKTCAGD